MLSDIDKNFQDKKITGSYYTPDELIDVIIESSLIPVIKNKILSLEPYKNLLTITVCDPSCGAGFLLVKAAETIASFLYNLTFSKKNHGYILYQKILREVINNCIYGVDLRETAVAMCKQNLINLCPDLDFDLTNLNKKIRQGNSVVGIMNMKDLEKGIPDDAYNCLSGDDKEICNRLKKENRRFRNSNLTLSL